MPLTAFQRRVLELLVRNRSEASHFAGGVALNAADDSARYSRDFDLFHDAVEDLARASEQDVRTIEAAGLVVKKVNQSGAWERPASYRQAVISGREGEVALDWAHDSAFRFYPIMPDPQLGWRLHFFDLAINKALALSARTETRDYVDMVEFGRRYPLEAIMWAACGKDPGFNPLSLLTMVLRFARIDPATLEEIQARRLDPVALKMEWIALTDRARAEMTLLANEQTDLPIGVAFVDEHGEPGWIRGNPALRMHRPTLRGCFPCVAGHP